jgi:hypothetical protein
MFAWSEMQEVRMVRVVMLVTVILTATSLQVLAQDRLAIGEGATSCGAWTQARQAQSTKAALIAQWIAGYVSGSNVEGDHPDALMGVDFKGLIDWIDNYCRSNPLDPVVAAAFKLTDELRSRAQRR